MNKLLKSLLATSQQSYLSSITLDGESTLTLPLIYIAAKKPVSILIKTTNHVQRRSKAVLNAMISQVTQGVPVYGVTSAYGGQAGRVLNKGKKQERLKQAKLLSEAITHVDVSTGPEIPSSVVRAAMLIRANMLLPGYSAIRPDTVQRLIELLNHNITPIVGFYGTLGASGDLAHNGRILSTLLHKPNTYVRVNNGKKVLASNALRRAGIKKVVLEPKEGLALVNGDNFSSAAGAIQIIETLQLMVINLGVNAMMVQALKGSNRNLHPLLSSVRPHLGQNFVARALQILLKGSQLAIDELKGPVPRNAGVIIQDVYSIRCLPQFMGPNWETIDQIYQTIELNANCVSDNPLWTTPDTVVPGEAPYQWVSGGNFLAMYMADSLDKLRKVLIHIVKLNDRHLSRLVNPNQNNQLSANISDPKSISQCTFKGLQTQMGMYDVFATTLAMPISTAFGLHEELNQDVTSHAMTSAFLNQHVLDLAKYALATNLVASCQAIDLRGGSHLLSPATQPIYSWIRQYIPYIEHEMPLGHLVEMVASKIIDSELVTIISSAINHEE